MSLLLTDNASPGSSDGMMPGFLVEEGRGHLTVSWPLLCFLVYICLNEQINDDDDDDDDDDAVDLL